MCTCTPLYRHTDSRVSRCKCLPMHVLVNSSVPSDQTFPFYNVQPHSAVHITTSSSRCPSLCYTHLHTLPWMPTPEEPMNQQLEPSPAQSRHPTPRLATSVDCCVTLQTARIQLSTRATFIHTYLPYPSPSPSLINPLALISQCTNYSTRCVAH